MKRILQVKDKATLMLISAILVLCAGFIISGCGTDPQLKTSDPSKGQYALDFTDCPVNPCLLGYDSHTDPVEPVENREITMEAWIKNKTGAAGDILTRSDVKKGVLLRLKSTSSPANAVIPSFEIKRVQSDGTSTVPYAVEGNAILLNSAWTYIAGVLTNQTHDSGVNGHPVCTGVDGDAADDPWHLDFYQGTANSLNFIACAETHDGQVSDDTPAASAYAHEPDGTTAGVGTFGGIVDEVRIWNVNRAAYLSECKNVELTESGNCNRTDNMVLYSRFNKGKLEKVSDWSGVMGDGTKEYRDPNNPGEFLHWDTGWTTNVPPPFR